jgi:hypothetical protein
VRTSAASCSTVLVNGRLVKFDHRLVGMHPEIPEQRVLENPYTYTYAE